MKRDLKVISSAFSSAQYNSETQELTIDWKGGSYLYSGVPLKVVLELENAPSQGAYLSRFIRYNYDFKKCS